MVILHASASTDPSSMSTTELKDELEKLGEATFVFSNRGELEFCVKAAREKNSIQVVSPPTQEQTIASSPSTNTEVKSKVEDTTSRSTKPDIEQGTVNVAAKPKPDVDGAADIEGGRNSTPARGVCEQFI